MFDSCSTDLHGIRFCGQACGGAFNDRLMDPAAHSPIFTGGALFMNGTSRARRTPVATDLFAVFRSRKPIDQALACRTLVLIVRCDVVELAAIELTFGLIVRGC